MDAFDADVLIHAATNHPSRSAVRRALRADEECVGSVILVPELLSKSLRFNAEEEVEELYVLLDFLTLLPLDLTTARLAAAVGASYGLKAVDAVHLATAVNAGADRFITNNRRDFPQTIEEIEVVYPDQL